MSFSDIMRAAITSNFAGAVTAESINAFVDDRVRNAFDGIDLDDETTLINRLADFVDAVLDYVGISESTVVGVGNLLASVAEHHPSARNKPWLRFILTKVNPLTDGAARYIRERRGRRNARGQPGFDVDQFRQDMRQRLTAAAAEFSFTGAEALSPIPRIKRGIELRTEAEEAQAAEEAARTAPLGAVYERVALMLLGIFDDYQRHDVGDAELPPAAPPAPAAATATTVSTPAGGTTATTQPKKPTREEVMSQYMNAFLVGISMLFLTWLALGTFGAGSLGSIVGFLGFVFTDFDPGRTLGTVLSVCLFFGMMVALLGGGAAIITSGVHACSTAFAWIAYRDRAGMKVVTQWIDRLDGLSFRMEYGLNEWIKAEPRTFEAATDRAGLVGKSEEDIRADAKAMLGPILHAIKGRDSWSSVSFLAFRDYWDGFWHGPSIQTRMMLTGTIALALALVTSPLTAMVFCAAMLVLVFVASGPIRAIVATFGLVFIYVSSPADVFFHGVGLDVKFVASCYLYVESAYGLRFTLPPIDRGMKAFKRLKPEFSGGIAGFLKSLVSGSENAAPIPDEHSRVTIDPKSYRDPRGINLPLTHSLVIWVIVISVVQIAYLVWSVFPASLGSVVIVLEAMSAPTGENMFAWWAYAAARIIMRFAIAGLLGFALAAEMLWNFKRLRSFERNQQLAETAIRSVMGVIITLLVCAALALVVAMILAFLGAGAGVFWWILFEA